MNKINVAIDGPAGAGKSSVSRIAAQKLNFLYIDTGAMYRSVGVYALHNKIDLKNKALISEMLKELDIKIDIVNNKQHIYINNEDITPFIRTPEASMAASAVALLPDVRLKLVDIQRKIAEDNNVIMDGRDIGSYVLPNADVKIFLTASVEERAKRRYDELTQKGVSCSLREVIDDMSVRDKQDTEREFSPLRQTEDSILIDTTGLNFEQSVEAVVNIIEKSLN